ncbi:hypothetical protein JKG47_08980 [Acidithiobacillus sp. MC6.1]|nr:hypothetical protein [Acidithiobacillus sp. MC6.1]
MSVDDMDVFASAFSRPTGHDLLQPADGRCSKSGNASGNERPSGATDLMGMIPRAVIISPDIAAQWFSHPCVATRGRRRVVLWPASW